MSWPYPYPLEHYIYRTTKEIVHGVLIITYLHEIGGGAWRYNDVITMINSGIHRFFTDDGRTRAAIMVLPGIIAPYLKTIADGVETNNLEELTWW
jgi:hypothetical protein